MPDHDQFVDQIRAFVQAVDQTRTPALEALAAAYAEACGEVGRRLAKCHRLLQQGLRSEAIQLAEIQPRVLDLIAALDFPERAAWDEIVQMYGLPQAPAIPAESASFLNEAYAEEDPILDLLRTHRRLALARSALPARIEVMRKLAARDANNPIWHEDLQAFEKVRFAEIQRESNQAAKDHDLDTIVRLLAELEDQKWAEPPPDSLLQPIRKLHAQFQGRRKRAMLTDIETQLNDAFAAFDPIRGRVARDRWRALSETVGLRADDPVLDRVAPALRWLESQDRQVQVDRRREEALRELDALLASPDRVGVKALEQLGGELLGLQGDLPESLAPRYHARLTEERARETRRRAWIIGGAAAASILVLTTIGGVYRSHARTDRAVRAATAVADMLELGELDQASEFLDKLTKTDASLVEAPEFADSLARLKTAQEKEVARSLQFDQAIRLADQAPAEQEKPESLESARALARLATEKAAVDQRTQTRRAAFLEDRARREAALRPRLQDLTDKADKVRGEFYLQGNIGEPSRFLAPLIELQTQSRTLNAETEHVGDELQGQAKALAKKIEDLSADLDKRQRSAAIEDQLTSRVAYAPDALFDPDGYADLLSGHGKLLPDASRIKEVETVSQEAKIWKSVVAWAKLVDRWEKEGSDLTPAQARARLDDCTKFVTDHPGFPAMSTAEKYKAHLEAAAHDPKDPASPIGRIRALLADTVIDSIWLVKVQPGPKAGVEGYYLTKKPPEGSNMLRYIENFDGRERTKAVVPQFIKYSDWSPQTQLATRYKPRLAAELTPKAWDDVMLALLADVRNDPQMDALLKMVLMKKITVSAMAGSLSLRKALGPTHAALDQSDVDTNVSWMDPASADANRLRPRAESLVTSLLPPHDDAVKMAQEERLSIDGILKESPRPVGWLMNRNTQWSIRTGKALPQDGPLWAAVPVGESQAVWKQVGMLQKGVAKVDPSAAEARAEGRPVFVLSK